jgi:hypothetical protein
MQLRCLLTVAFYACLFASHLAAAEKTEYSVDDFVTSYWFGPPAEFMSFERYQEIKDCNFTVAFAFQVGHTPERNKQMLDWCQRLGMKGIIYDSRMTTSIGGSESTKKALDEMVRDYADHPALLAYKITDEPHAGAFDGLAEINAHLKSRDPEHPGYINLLPTWARQIPHPEGKPEYSYLGTKSYEEYVRLFVQKVKPAWLCYDNYSMLKQGDRGDFHENLATVRKVAFENNLPFWNIVLVTQHGDYRVLTESELRFEAMQTMAFGARGLMWFTYWSPEGYDTGAKWTHALIEQGGKRSPHYDMVKAINADVLAIGRELKTSKNVAVTQHGGDKNASYVIGESPVKIEAGKVTLGTFHDAAAGTHLALVTNLDYKEPTTAKLTVPAGASQALERFDPATRKWSHLESPKGTATLELPPGAGTLIRWNP